METEVSQLLLNKGLEERTNQMTQQVWIAWARNKLFTTRIIERTRSCRLHSFTIAQHITVLMQQVDINCQIIELVVLNLHFLGQ